MSERIRLNDLPKYSRWPSRVLGIEPWGLHRKTAAEIVREYEKEKWQPLLKRVRASEGVDSIEKVDQLIFEGVSTPLACWIKGSLKVMLLQQFHQQYLKFVENSLKVFMPASAIVDLGCGYGSIILNLAKRKPFRKTALMAADFVPSASQLTQEIAQRQGVKIVTGYCDLGAVKMTDLPIPDGAIIFTSYSAAYIPQVQEKFIKSLSKYNPRAVVHFEACYEHFDPNTLLGLMRQRYVQLNDYNQNLLTLLKEQQRAKKIKILMEKPLVMGNNVLLPASLVVWKPLSRK